MSSQTLLELTGDVQRLANEFTVSRQSDQLDALLNTALRTIETAAVTLERDVSILNELPEERQSPLPVSRRVKQSVTAALKEAEPDPITFVQSDAGQELSRDLSAAASETRAEAAAAYGRFCIEVRQQYPEGFVSAMKQIATFAAAARAISENWERVVNLSELQTADPRMIGAAKAVRAAVDEGIKGLNDRVPPEIRQQLLRAVDGTLRITDLDPDFVQWIRANALEASFRVSVR